MHLHANLAMFILSIYLSTIQTNHLPSYLLIMCRHTCLQSCFVYSCIPSQVCSYYPIVPSYIHTYKSTSLPSCLMIHMFTYLLTYLIFTIIQTIPNYQSFYNHSCYYATSISTHLLVFISTYLPDCKHIYQQYTDLATYKPVSCLHIFPLTNPLQINFYFCLNT